MQHDAFFVGSDPVPEINLNHIALRDNNKKGFHSKYLGFLWVGTLEQEQQHNRERRTLTAQRTPAQLRADSHGWYRLPKNSNTKFHGTRGHAYHPSVRHSALRRQRQRVPLTCARGLEVTPHSYLVCRLQAVKDLVPSPATSFLGPHAGPTALLAAFYSICRR